MSETKTVAGAYAKIEAHEELCAERYGNIHTVLSELKSSSGDTRKLLVGVLIAVLGFMAQQLYAGQQERLTRLEHPAPVQTTVVTK